MGRIGPMSASFGRPRAALKRDVVFLPGRHVFLARRPRCEGGGGGCFGPEGEDEGLLESEVAPEVLDRVRVRFAEGPEADEVIDHLAEVEALLQSPIVEN